MNDTHQVISQVPLPADPELSQWLDADRSEMPVEADLRLRLKERIALRRALISTPSEPATGASTSPILPSSLSAWSWRSALLGTLLGSAIGSVLTWAVLSQFERPEATARNASIESPTVAPQNAANEQDAIAGSQERTDESPSSPTTPRTGVQTDPSQRGERQPASAENDEQPAVSTLRREQLLLEGARSALSRGQFADAISLADAHARQFPRGLLQEEREFVWIRALEGSGQHQAAISRAEDFVAAYPSSPYARRIEGVIPSWRRTETTE